MLTFRNLVILCDQRPFALRYDDVVSGQALVGLRLGVLAVLLDVLLLLVPCRGLTVVLVAKCVSLCTC